MQSAIERRLLTSGRPKYRTGNWLIENGNRTATSLRVEAGIPAKYTVDFSKLIRCPDHAANSSKT